VPGSNGRDQTLSFGQQSQSRFVGAVAYQVQGGQRQGNPVANLQLPIHLRQGGTHLCQFRFAPLGAIRGGCHKQGSIFDACPVGLLTHLFQEILDHLAYPGCFGSIQAQPLQSPVDSPVIEQALQLLFQGATVGRRVGQQIEHPLADELTLVSCQPIGRTLPWIEATAVHPAGTVLLYLVGCLVTLHGAQTAGQDLAGLDPRHPALVGQLVGQPVQTGAIRAGNPEKSDVLHNQVEGCLVLNQQHPAALRSSATENDLAWQRLVRGDGYLADNRPAKPTLCHFWPPAGRLGLLLLALAGNQQAAHQQRSGAVVGKIRSKPGHPHQQQDRPQVAPTQGASQKPPTPLPARRGVPRACRGMTQKTQPQAQRFDQWPGHQYPDQRRASSPFPHQENQQQATARQPAQPGADQPANQPGPLQMGRPLVLGRHCPQQTATAETTTNNGLVDGLAQFQAPQLQAGLKASLEQVEGRSRRDLARTTVEQLAQQGQHQQQIQPTQPTGSDCEHLAASSFGFRPQWTMTNQGYRILSKCQRGSSPAQIQMTHYRPLGASKIIYDSLC